VRRGPEYADFQLVRTYSVDDRVVCTASYSSACSRSHAYALSFHADSSVLLLVEKAYALS
jgi:hypothetical protein